MIVWLVITATTIAWVMVYAARIKKDPTRSPMHDLDAARRADILRRQEESGAFTLRHALSLTVLFAGVVMMIVGVSVFGWYITELSALFLAMGVLAGVVAGQHPNTLAKNFILGVKDMAGAALIVGFTGGIIVVLESGNIMDTILYALASVTSNMPKMLAADAMYVMQMALNFFKIGRAHV